MFDPFRRTASTLINSAILNSNSRPSPNLLQNITMQQQIFRIAKYILLCTKIILVCSNGFINPIIKTEASHFAVFPLKAYNYSKFAMYLENHGRLGFWRKICHVKIHAPSKLAGVHAILKVAHCLLPFDGLQCAFLFLLFFLMLLLSCFWRIYKCIKMQLNSFSFERWLLVVTWYAQCGGDSLSKNHLYSHSHTYMYTYTHNGHATTYIQPHLYTYLRSFDLVLLTIIRMFVYIWCNNSWIKCLL